MTDIDAKEIQNQKNTEWLHTALTSFLIGIFCGLMIAYVIDLVWLATRLP